MGQFFLASPCAITPVIMRELLPTPRRHRRGRRAASNAIAIFGGTTPYLQTWMSARFGATSFAFYVMAPSGRLVDHGLVHAGNPRAGAPGFRGWPTAWTRNRRLTCEYER
jgi:hypothetical protein